MQTVDHWGDVLINTSAPSHWLKSVGDHLSLSLNLGIFRTVNVLIQCGQIEWQSSCRTRSCRYIAQKESIRFTKLPLPCNSVHANSYTETKSKDFPSTAI